MFLGVLFCFIFKFPICFSSSFLVEVCSGKGGIVYRLMMDINHYSHLCVVYNPFFLFFN